MKVLQVYNEFRSLCGGEETVINNIADILTKKGIDVELWKKSSREIDNNLYRKGKAFLSGIYNIFSYRQMYELIESLRPDIVHVHNLYPLFSPSILVACKKSGIPVIMTVHNYALTCPNWYHLNNGELCEKCIKKNEFWCVLNNCRNNLFESTAYALRTMVARKLKLFINNVTSFIALTQYSKERLIKAGIRENQIEVLPHMVKIPLTPTDPSKGKYIAYAGRISPEKGIDTLLYAANLTGLPIRLAGSKSHNFQPKNLDSPNVRWLGLLDKKELLNFYRDARFLVVPSIWFEVFGMVAIEAMAHGLPVIASRIGALPYIIDDGTTGLLVQPGDGDELAEKMEFLWNQQELCVKMGVESRKKVFHEYSEDKYCEGLLSIYQKAIKNR